MDYIFRGFYPDKNGTQVIVVNGKEYKGKWIEGDLLSKCKCSPKISIDGEYNRGLFVVDSYEVLPETVGEYIKSLPNGDKAFSNSRFEIISNVKGENGDSGKRTDTATIRFNEKQCEWELKVSHKGKYKRIARAGYFLNNSNTKVIGTIFDKEEV